jgi:hypothetical protein
VYILFTLTFLALPAVEPEAVEVAGPVEVVMDFHQQVELAAAAVVAAQAAPEKECCR